MLASPTPQTAAVAVTLEQQEQQRTHLLLLASTHQRTQEAQLRRCAVVQHNFGAGLQQVGAG